MHCLQWTPYLTSDLEHLPRTSSLISSHACWHIESLEKGGDDQSNAKLTKALCFFLYQIPYLLFIFNVTEIIHRRNPSHASQAEKLGGITDTL